MDFFEAVKNRRSIRRYTTEPVPPVVVEKALQAAILAPNSSNMQLSEFYWVQSAAKKEALVQACLNQGAARTAQELVVFITRPSNWRRNVNRLLEHLKAQNSPLIVFKYYQKLIPMTYGMHWATPLKKFIIWCIGLFRPITRRPASFWDIEEVCIKSTALACENFMLAVSAQGFDSCPMEGFDETRVKKILGLKKWSDRVVMVISVGKRDPKGVWGTQYRHPQDWFIKKI